MVASCVTVSRCVLAVASCICVSTSAAVGTSRETLGLLTMALYCWFLLQCLYIVYVRPRLLAMTIHGRLGQSGWETMRFLSSMERRLTVVILFLLLRGHLSYR